LIQKKHFIYAMKQTPSSVFMVRPEHFGFNPQTAASNAFQPDEIVESNTEIKKSAIAQFDGFVENLRSHGINVYVFHSPKYKKLPDAVFPNNWVTFHEDGRVILYPMLAENRRLERRLDVIDKIGEAFVIKEVIDLSVEEVNELILEGSGSIVFDHINMIAYANESPRTNKMLFDRICDLLGYEGVFFNATDAEGLDIFHTNVMMMIGEGYSVICAESIPNSQQETVLNKLKKSGLEIIEISRKQMSDFAGNMIQLQNPDGRRFLVMSDTAFASLSDIQKQALLQYNEIIHSDVSTIEHVGGGSARCMIAGIHLPGKTSEA
jgi:hypothetical protein